MLGLGREHLGVEDVGCQKPQGGTKGKDVRSGRGVNTSCWPPKDWRAGSCSCCGTRMLGVGSTGIGGLIVMVSSTIMGA